jgi:hypothetical protein
MLYLAENTPCDLYKGQKVTTVQRNNLSLFLESYKTHKCIIWKKAALYVKHMVRVCLVATVF